MSGNTAIEENTEVIRPRHVYSAVRNDRELSELLHNLGIEIENNQEEEDDDGDDDEEYDYNSVVPMMLTIPVTVASAERSFSKLKLIKSYLRSTMLQERLSGLALLSIEHDLIEKIDYASLMNEFASRNVERAIFYKNS